MVVKQRIAMTGLLLLASGCGGPKDVEIRAVGPSLAKSTKPQSARIAEAAGHLALGNVALALEQYRIAAREDGQSIEALSGMATCYRKLGRPELAQRQLELALAVSPDDPALLNALAEALDAQGLSAKAAMVRAEIASDPVQLASMAPSQTLPKALEQSDAVAVEPTRSAVVSVAAQSAPKLAVTTTAPISAPKVAVPQAPEPRAEASLQASEVKQAPVTAAGTLTVKLPPAAPMRAATPIGKVAGPSVTVALAPARKPTQVAAPKPVAPRSGPRLERLSLGEVALTTTGSTRWAKLVSPALPKVAYARVQPARTPALRILNAARVQGLAGSARAMLMRRGWRAIEVSDAPKVRTVSLLYVPRSRAQTAARLAAQFSFPVRLVPSTRDFVLVLGTNASVKRARA